MIATAKAAQTIESRATAYIKDHFFPEDKLCVALIDQKTGHVKQEIRTAKQIVEPQYQAHLRAANLHGANVYCTVNTLKPEAFGRTKADIDQVRHVYLDVDGGGKEALSRILGSEGMPKPHSVLETSPGKHQIIWSVEGFSHQQAEALTRDMAAYHQADQAVFDSARVLRIPGFRNCKYDEPHFVKDVQTDKPERIYRPEDFPKYQIEREQAPVFGSRAAGNQSRVAGGSQSEKDYAYAMRRLESGDSPDKIMRDVADFRRSRNDKAYPDAYAKRTVENALRAHAMKVSSPIQAPSRAHNTQEHTR